MEAIHALGHLGLGLPDMAGYRRVVALWDANARGEELIIQRFRPLILVLLVETTLRETGKLVTRVHLDVRMLLPHVVNFYHSRRMLRGAHYARVKLLYSRSLLIFQLITRH